jgi:hypothetical protein
MTLDEIKRLIIESTADNWNVVAVDERDDHQRIAVYKADLSVAIAWGLQHLADFQEGWVAEFDDPHASSEFVDVLYNGVPVDRELRVIVDGGRAGLPVPKPGDDARSVERWPYELLRVVQEMSGGWDYDDYVRRARLTVVD